MKKGMTWSDMNTVLGRVADEELLALDRYRGRPAMEILLHSPEGKMSERFLKGIPDRLSPADLRAYRTGEWLVSGPE
jgi:hypothetical protein